MRPHKWTDHATAAANEAAVEFCNDLGVDDPHDCPEEHLDDMQEAMKQAYDKEIDGWEAAQDQKFDEARDERAGT